VKLLGRSQVACASDVSMGRYAGGGSLRAGGERVMLFGFEGTPKG